MGSSQGSNWAKWIVLLEGEPLTQSEVLGTPKLILIRFIFILSLLQLFFKPDRSLILKNTPTP